MDILYIKMSRREKLLGWGWFAVMAMQILLNGANILPPWINALNCGVLLYLMRDFLHQSRNVPLTSDRAIVGYALLGLVLTQLTNLLFNDLVYNFYTRYYTPTLTGPQFDNALRKLLLVRAGEHPLLFFVSSVVLVPIVDELIHRGLIFGTIHRKYPTLAYLVSLAVYGALHTIPLLGGFKTDFIVLNFLQYIPMCLFFPWVYLRSQTILTPILAHMILNAVSFFTMR